MREMKSRESEIRSVTSSGNQLFQVKSLRHLIPFLMNKNWQKENDVQSFIKGGIMEGSNFIIDETQFVEQYANTDSLDTALVVVGFMEDKTAYLKQYNPDDEDEPDWQPWGSSADYTSNEAFANLNGCPFKIDSTL